MIDSSCDVTVPGLANIGNSCYLNAALQAMGSSPVFCERVAQLAALLQETQKGQNMHEPAPSLTERLFSTLHAGWRFLLHGKSKGW